MNSNSNSNANTHVSSNGNARSNSSNSSVNNSSHNIHVPNWIKNLLRKVWNKIKQFFKWVIKNPGTCIKTTFTAIWGLTTVFIPICWVSWAGEWDHIIKTESFVENHLPNKAYKSWEDTLGKIRIYESREYILDLMCDPPQMSEICETRSQNLEYRRDIYVNHYFTLFCIYADDTLQGFLIIGNKENFHLKSYRGNIELFSDTVSTASDKINGYRCLISSSSTGRYSRNSYYVECRVQDGDASVPNTLIGYGCCSLSNAVDIFEPQYPVVDMQNPNWQDYYDLYRFNDYSSQGWSWNDYCDFMNEFVANDEVDKFRKNTLVNTFFIFNDNMQLLKNALLRDKLGICTDSYYNLCDDYTKIVDENRNRMKERFNDITQNNISTERNSE